MELLWHVWLINGSIFLRFLYPAILSPNLCGLTQESPHEKSSRKFTLIEKTLKTIANFSKFGPKDSYTKFMSNFFEKESENMRRFLANISELDCSRLFRLICKLNTLLERPEHSINQAWSETGDRYILKLFRDFIFHSIGFEGEPVMDMAHIFDAGSHDKICLTSRDEQNVIIVSYSELHQAFERSFTELMNYGSTGSS
ncbi:unnamed protein product [Rotaria sp. Silwood1]|nr:unnamed protein product [Rotaria sp. Silwood1]